MRLWRNVLRELIAERDDLRERLKTATEEERLGLEEDIAGLNRSIELKQFGNVP